MRRLLSGLATAARTSALGLWVVFTACSPSKVYVDRLEVQAVEGADVLGLSKDEVQALLVTRLQDARFVVLKRDEKPPSDAKVYRLTAAAEAEEPDPEKGAVVHVGARLTLRAKGLDDDSFYVEAREKSTSRSNSVDDLQSAARDALVSALSHAAQEGRATLELEPLSDDAIVKKLEQKGPMRDAAIRALAIRRHKAVLPILLGRLKTDDVDELRRSMGLLVELHDDAAVVPLIEAAQRKSPVVVREIAYALGALGGEDAEAWLFTIAQGHDDEVVRASARQALDELETRMKKERK